MEAEMKDYHRAWPFEILISTVLIAGFMTGCLRYVAPRSELEKQAKSVGDEKGENLSSLGSLGGKDEFLAYEQKLAARQSGFIKDRQTDYSQLADSAYVVGPGDVVTVQVFGFPDMSGDFEVAPDGSLTLPVLGTIDAGGRKILDLRSTITSGLGKYVRGPRAQVGVKEYQAERVFVTGEVARPGMYSLKRNGQQLLELIAEAGGRTERAGTRVIVVPKVPEAGESVANGSNNRALGVEFNSDDLTGSADQAPFNVPLRGGDTIIVPESGDVEVYGEVIKPGSYKLGGKTSALGAVASAGGFTYSAKVDEVEVIRDIGGGKRAALVVNLEDIALKGVQDMRLRDGDIVRVPSDSGLFAKRQIVDIINGTFRGSVGVR